MRRAGVLLVTAALFAACSVRRNGGGTGDDGGRDGARPIDGGAVPEGGGGYRDALGGGDSGRMGMESPNACLEPAPLGCGASERCDDGVDNDCDGEVEERCSCDPGAVRPCFRGPPGRRGTGVCVDGSQTCIAMGEFGEWGACEGGIGVSAEVCDGADNDCNGCPDDDLCCTGPLRCPEEGDERVPPGRPLADYDLRGGDFFDEREVRARSWQWHVVGGPCDQLLYRTAGATSYTLNGDTAEDAEGENLTIGFTLSGDYTVTLTVRGDDGRDYTCTFIIHVVAPGLRVELCWDTTGDSDIDLHLHRPRSRGDWFGGGGPFGGGGTGEDCYYRNCKASTDFASELDWGYRDTDVENCEGAPEGEGDLWRSNGSCHNPRLDVDNISTEGIPENINVDRPNEGDTFRVMVHYFGGDVTTHPVVNVYCGGALVGTYGAAPDELDRFNRGDGEAMGQMWRVVDVTTLVPGMDRDTDCELDPIHPPGERSGYYLTDGDTRY